MSYIIDIKEYVEAIRVGTKFDVKNITAVNGKVYNVEAEVELIEKSCYVPYFMVRYGDARDLNEIIDLKWDYDIETVVKHFVKKAIENGLNEFKIIDSNGFEYYVKVNIEESKCYLKKKEKR